MNDFTFSLSFGGPWYLTFLSTLFGVLIGGLITFLITFAKTKADLKWELKLRAYDAFLELTKLVLVYLRRIN